MKLQLALRVTVILTVVLFCFEHYLALNTGLHTENPKTVNTQIVDGFINDYEELILRIKAVKSDAHGYRMLISILNNIDIYNNFNVSKARDITSMFDSLQNKQRIQVFIDKDNHSLMLIQILVSKDNSYTLEKAQLLIE